MPEYPEICISHSEIRSILCLHRKEIFPQLRKLARSRGLFYSQFDSGAPKTPDLKFKTRRDRAGNLYLQNFFEAPDRSL
jgi:hypothetical protein